MPEFFRRGDRRRQSRHQVRRPSVPPAPVRRWPVLVLVLLALAAGAGGALSAGRPEAGARTVSAAGPDRSPFPSPAPFQTASPSPAPFQTASPSPATVAPLLQLAGPVPATGRGTFGYDDRPGATLGRAGTVQRYRVAVENGAGEDVHAFSDVVQEALAGPGSWVDGGGLRLRRVPGGSPAEFTVFLVTAGTAGRMCLAGGVDIRVDGRPYTSCRAPGKVIINLDRWRMSVPHLVRAGVPLSLYRLYVVNHEVGHQLGHRHEGCPGAGRPAPVMQQQTLFLDGCTANPWPYLGGRRYLGPSV